MIHWVKHDKAQTSFDRVKHSALKQQSNHLVKTKTLKPSTTSVKLQKQKQHKNGRSTSMQAHALH
jgi:hypothetical protein